MNPQPLSTVIDAPIINSFLADDHTHQSIFNTLLESHVTGIDSEIRTEYANGKATRFPVLILCLDGLERLLDKNEKARKLLEEKIRAEGGQPGVYGTLVQSLPVARTGVLIASHGGEDIEVLKRKLEAEYAESNAKLREQLEVDNREKLAKREQEMLDKAAEYFARSEREVEAQVSTDIEKFKEKLRDDNREEQARLLQQRRSDDAQTYAQTYAKLKDNLEKINSEELARLKEQLRRESVKELNEWKREDLAKLNQQLRKESAKDLDEWKRQELEQLKRAMYSKAAMDELAKQFQECEKIREAKAAEDLAKEKKLLEKAARDLAKLQNDLERSNAEVSKLKREIHNKTTIAALDEDSDMSGIIREGKAAEHATHAKMDKRLRRYSEKQSKRMKEIDDNFRGLVKKSFIQYDDITITHLAAVKMLSKNKTIFEKYKDLCVEALTRYKRDLKRQYHLHLTDIERECRQWLRVQAGQGLRVGVLDGLRKTVEKGWKYNGNIPSIEEDVGAKITQESLDQELVDITAEFKEMQSKSVFQGGLWIPPFNEEDAAEPQVQDAGIPTGVDISSVYNDPLENRIDRSDAAAALKEVQAKARLVLASKNIHTGFTEMEMQPEPMEQPTRKTNQGKALGKSSMIGTAAQLGWAELRERPANIEQPPHPQNVAGVNPTTSTMSQNASLRYAAKENIPMSTANINQVTKIRGRKSNVRVHQAEIEGDVTRIRIAEIRANNAKVTSSMPSFLMEGRESTAREEIAEVSRPNRINDSTTIKRETKELIIPQPGKKAIRRLTAKEIQSVSAAKEISQLADVESRNEGIVQVKPLEPRSFASKQERFETSYAGQTVNEIYESLRDGKGAKRKRLSGSEGSEEIPFRKK